MPSATPRRLLGLLALALCALVLAAAPALAQTAPETRRVVLMDGTVIVGTITDETADPVVVVTAAGVEQRVPRASIREITGLFAGRFTRLDPARTRLFLTPTGRMLGNGNGRFSAYYIFPSVAYGVGDRFDVSAGTTIPLISSDGGGVVLNFNAKGQVMPLDPGGGVALGASALVPITSGQGQFYAAGTVYGVATIGSETSAVTLGGSVVYTTSAEDFEFGSGVVALIGLEHQVSNNIKLMSENYVGIGTDLQGALLSGGVRFFGDRLAADVAAVLVISNGSYATIPIPYLGVSYTF